MFSINSYCCRETWAFVNTLWVAPAAQKSADDRGHDVDNGQAQAAYSGVLEGSHSIFIESPASYWTES